MKFDLSAAIFPIEVTSTFVSLITFMCYAILFFLALSDQKIVASDEPDTLDRIVVSDAILNETFRLVIGLAMLIIWISGLLTPVDPDRERGITLVGVALVTMIPFIQLLLLVWGIKNLLLRRRILRDPIDHETIHKSRVVPPPDLPPGDS